MIYYAYNYYLCNKIKHAIMTTPLQERLFALQDKQYAAFIGHKTKRIFDICKIR